jgi:hypothetical protein
MAQAPEWVIAGVLVADALEALGVRYVFAGGVASIIHGEIRTTLDADLLADLRPEHVEPLVAALAPDFFVEAESIREAITGRRSFNVIHKETMFKVDVFIPRLRPFDRAQLEHRVERLVARNPDHSAWVASPEDTVLAKIEWFQMSGGTSERQWRDVLGVLKAREGLLDLDYLRRTAAMLGVQDLLELALAGAAPPEEPDESGRQSRLL